MNYGYRIFSENIQLQTFCYTNNVILSNNCAVIYQIRFHGANTPNTPNAPGDHPENNLDMYNDPANWHVPFDSDGQSGPGDPPTPPTPYNNVGVSTTNLPSQDYSGFWGAVKYFWTEGIADGYKYNMDGNVIGVAPLMGNPPVPAFRGGSVVKTLQTGNHILKQGTLKALGITQEQGKRAIEALKRVNDGLRNNTHYIIKADGSIINPNTGFNYGTLFDYLY